MLNSLFEEFQNIIVLDLETTGIDHRRDEIIELAALRIERDGAEREIDMFVRLSEGRSLPPEITQLTGITPQMIDSEGREKAAVGAALCELLECESPLVIAYNAQFDLCFLYYFLNRLGRADCLKSCKFLDALTVYKDRRAYPHKLSDAVSQYALKTQNTHRAIDDARAALELMCAMESERDDLRRYVNLFGYNERYGVSGAKISSITYLPQGMNGTGRLYERIKGDLT